MITATTRTQVAVIGAGPAGLTTANLLRQRGVDCVVLEAQSREFIEQRPRAGFLEEWAVRELERRGLAGRLLQQAGQHGAFEFRFAARRHTVRYAELTGHHHFVYPQQELVTDLVAAYADGSAGDIRFGVRDVRLHDLTGDSPSVTYTDPHTGQSHRVECAYIAGCDGARGVSRRHIPAHESVFASHDYGIGWLALLVEAPPSADGVVFGIHPRGFAAHMARTPQITRFYLQCPPGDDPANWSHERVWQELHTRLAVPGAPITEGRIVERQVLDMHNYVVEPMSYGRLHLAGDSAHLVAPIGAKGMNLALHDAFLLSAALTAQLRHGDGARLAGYSADCLRRVWQYQEFSQWFADVLHGATHADPFHARMAEARLQRLLSSPAAATAFCELYIGKL
ncbi:4-hydroxybenzoate 3-monooxygenase [Streptantibioticus ferralitis]|uniref:4-hydroxybenzoate 3-monooxygenase n=1 Tax=Streptantibioticus ferralitis TaxID=236510 RepID=A0ABT5Z1U0_9ACTN|nr:4-hydroxybenzoate 3-monooxygenase [Streptantibioticus ferralitis]MDF2257813.1 4-hydroxybenzoate 3-monooxygenase [Streptantibioticus ferralitis]